MSNNLPIEKKVLAISMLAEGSSIRSIERVTGVHRDTMMRLGVRIGKACGVIHDEKMSGLKCKILEVDEVWRFIGKKKKHIVAADSGVGDVWTFIGIDVESKLIPSYLVGKRDAYHANTFMADLAARIVGRIQLTTDALRAYPDGVERAFGSEIDYAQLVKTYSVSHLGTFVQAATRYSPAEVVKTEKHRLVGNPVKELVSTSHIESQNLTLRMHCRRLTRLTNAFSKKLPNFEAAVALNFSYYNFCKRHISIRMTPAMAAGVEKSTWTVAELVEHCEMKST
jgi:IS1 family transposase